MRRKVPLPPYLAAFVASLSALLAAASCLPWPFFSLSLILVNLVAFPVSMWMRSRGVDKAKASALAVLLGGLFLLPYLKSLPLVAFLLSSPLSFSAYQALQFIVASFAFFLAFRNFSLVTDFDLTATLVPSTAILLLVAILSPGMHFAAFLFPAMLSFMVLLAFEHRRLLSYGAKEVGAGEEARERSSGWEQAKGPTFIGMASVVIALLLAHFEVKFSILPFIPLNFQSKAADFISSLIVRAGKRLYGCIEPALDLASNPAFLTDEVLFIVKAERPSYWRGTSFEVYTGRWWTHFRMKPRKVPAKEGEALLPPIDEAVRGGKFFLLQQEFRMVRPLIGGIFSAYEPWKVKVPGARRFNLRPDGAVNFSMVLGEGEVYQVVSRVPKRSEKELSEAPKSLPSEIAEVYLQLPPHLPQRVYQLARKVAGDAPNWLEAARRVETFLKRNYEPSLSRQLAPPGEDFVDHFLFRSKEGFCIHFASAMAVMLRCLGIPSRIAAGFATGLYDRALGAYLVRENDAHAWVEVYFPGHGWVAFDPTPEEAVGGPHGLGMRLKLFLFSAGQLLRGWWQGLKGWARGIPWGLALFALLAASFLALLGWQLSRRKASLPLFPLRLSRDKDPAVEAYRAMLHLLSRQGLGRMPWETAFEHLSRVGVALGEVSFFARRLAEFYVERVYGERLPERSSVEEALSRFRASLRRRRFKGERLS